MGEGKDIYNHITNTKIFDLKINKISIQAPNITREVAMV